ncbi:Acyl-CoA N-acyltransferases (NAT) superfamily protein [Heracleum sosnowskyi]|uniref:Acyl-CoA N-acyltransferases (NAT) superfamily protein n=1 Tax=Heracleum sosnowskyi TaxID=360622 RepID=A0AAD8JMS2_9APIA|nr:Acyl-CoA N-acyltransferases (NAT) superfamily protein [Heracleum sosnowskyi]
MGSWNITELQRNSNKWEQTVDQIVRIEKKIFPKHESLARSFETELAKKNSGLLYILDSVADDNDNVAGYVMFSWPSSLCATITKLAVKEKYRRQGHGEALLTAGIEKCRARNVHRISLHVDPSRTAALNLYKKFGFQVDSLVERYYSSDRNAYRMYLDFEIY